MRRALVLRTQTWPSAQLHASARNTFTPALNSRLNSTVAQPTSEQSFPPPPPPQILARNEGPSRSHKKPHWMGRGNTRLKRLKAREEERQKGTVQTKSRKIKAESSDTGRMAQHQKLKRPVLQYDQRTLQRTLTLPNQTSVPGLPRRILTNTVEYFKNAEQRGLCSLSSNEVSLPLGAFRNILTLSFFDGGSIEAIGEGEGKKAAERAAFLHLLAKIHEQGRLSSVLTMESDRKTLKEESDAKLDVYIFAAKYGLVPRFSSRTIGTSRRTQPFIETTIELPELALKAVGRSRRTIASELSASINFKAEIERLLSRESSNFPVVDESLTLSPANARSFFTWYKQSSRQASQLYIESQQKNGAVHAQAFLQDATQEEKKPLSEVVRLPSKKSAEDVATLIAALYVTKDQPEMLKDFFREFRKNNNQILEPVPPMDFDIHDDALVLMQDIIASAPESESGELAEDFHKDFDIKHGGIMYRALSDLESSSKSKELLRKLNDYRQREDLATLRQTRADYPMNQYIKDVLDIVHNNLYSIIIGATGSGKTTQVPQILLNDAIVRGEGAKCNIICTQPRRIAAKSVSLRVAEERAEDLGDSVGYHVRRDPKTPRPGGSINYCTTGILSQQLQFAANEIMDNVSHLIIDEVHERDIIIDFLLTTLKKLVAERIAKGKHVPHIILMSATIDSELFANYFSTNHPERGVLDCPTLSVPGRTFPVKEKYINEVLSEIEKAHGKSAFQNVNRDKDSVEYLEAEKNFAKANALGTSANNDDESKDDSDSGIDWKLERGKALRKGGLETDELEEALVPNSLVATTIAHLAKTTKEGAILVFLPGLENITSIGDILRDESPLGLNFRDESKYRTFMLHSSIPNAQTEVFDTMAPGCRKIILSTNIAETSITIPDVQYVIDTGKLRENQYDQMRRITKLACIWASKSNAKQRAGRAGRVQNGNYYALYSKERFRSLRAVGLPEILRSDLQEVCLDVKAQGFKIPVAQFLAESIEPPPPESVYVALDALKSLECLTEDERLTPIGRLLASLPIHPSLGKMIVLGIVFRCLDPLLIVGAAFNERSLFISPLENKQAAKAARKTFSQDTGSDHIGLLNAIREMRYINETRGPRALQDFAIRNWLHMGAFRSILGTAETIETILAESNIVPKTPKFKRAQFQFGDPSLNVNSDKVPLIKALTLTGFYPNIGVHTHGPLYRTPGENFTLIHPSSILGDWRRKGRKDDQTLQDPEKKPKTEKLLAYSSMGRSNDGQNTYLRDVSPITPLIASLFGGRITSANGNNRIITMDDWLRFYIKSQDSRAAGIFRHFREQLDKVQAQAFVDIFRRANLAQHPVRAAFALGIVELLQLDATDPNAPRGSKWDRFMDTLTASSERRSTARRGNSWDDLMDTWDAFDKPTVRSKRSDSKATNYYGGRR